MSRKKAGVAGTQGDVAPGDPEFGTHGGTPAAVRNYLIGFALAAGFTVAAFWIASGPGVVYTPGIAMALAALAVGQMGVHLVFFLHITSGSDNINNVLALAFGVLIVGIVIAGSLWIMYHLNGNMMMPSGMTDLHRQI